MYLIYQKRKHFKILLLCLKYTNMIIQPSTLSVPIWSVRSQNECIRNYAKENKSLLTSQDSNFLKYRRLERA